MSKKDIILGWLRRFGWIHGLTMTMTYIVAVLVKPDAVFGVPFLGNMLLFSIAGTLPGIIYYTSREISEKEWWIRTIIHYVLLNALLLPISHGIGLWSGIGGCAIFVVCILVIDILVHLLSFGLDWIVARDINKMLQNRNSVK